MRDMERSNDASVVGPWVELVTVMIISKILFVHYFECLILSMSITIQICTLDRIEDDATCSAMTTAQSQKLNCPKTMNNAWTKDKCNLLGATRRKAFHEVSLTVLDVVVTNAMTIKLPGADLSQS